MAATPAEAATASPLVLLCVTDFAAASAVLDQVGPAIAGRVLVNLTTATPVEAARIADWAHERGAEYLGGAVQSVPGQIGGDPADFVPFAERQLGYVVGGVADTAREVGGRAYAVGPASLREHATVLEQIIEMRRADGVGPGRLAGLASIARDLVSRGHGDQGFNRVVAELRV